MTSERSYGESGRLPLGGLSGRTIAVGLVLGAVAGAAVGAAVGASRPVVHHATTVASILPDAVVTQSQLGGASQTQDSTDFIQSELVVLNGEQLLTRVQRQLKLPERPAVTSSQIGATYVVNIVASDRDAARAEAIANTTRMLYAQQRQTQLANDINAALTTVRAQISSVRSSIAAAPAKAAAGGASNALQQNYAQLLSTSNSLQLATGQVGRAVTTIQPSTVTDGGASPTKKGGLAGLVVGALLGAALLVAFRRLRPRVRVADDLSSLGVSALSPTLPPVSARHRAAARGPARLLATRLTGFQYDGTRQPRTPAVVLIGLERGVGTTFSAAEIAAALAVSGPVIYLQAAGTAGEAASHFASGTRQLRLSPHDRGATELLLDTVAEQSSTGVLAVRLSARQILQAFDAGVEAVAAKNGAVVIVDAPPVQDDDLGARLARGGARIVLVVARRRSRPAQVLVAVEALEATGARTVDVLLTSPRRRAAGAGRRADGASETAPISPASEPAPIPSVSEPAPIPSVSEPAPIVSAVQPPPSLAGGNVLSPPRHLERPVGVGVAENTRIAALRASAENRQT